MLHVLVSHIKNMTLQNNGEKKKENARNHYFSYLQFTIRGDFTLNKMSTEIQGLKISS